MLSTAHTQRPRDHGSGAVELAVVMGGVFFLLCLALLTAVNFLAAQAASSAAQRALQIAQTPGQNPSQASDVACRLATASGVVTASRLAVSRAPQTVTASVTVRTVLGATISRTVTGPQLRFVPQQPQ